LFLAECWVFCDIEGIVRVFVTGSLFLFFCSSSLMSGVASNPFLRPSPNVPPRQVTPLPTPKPPQKINPNLSKEVEFRGYFIYRGEPHFCIFNKKSNHGEWIKLNEKTYEEFQAHSFDLEKESVTLRFNGQDIVLTLEKSKVDSTAPSTPSKIPLPKPKNYSSNSQYNASSVPGVMPPKPTARPKLPDWLLSAQSSGRTANLLSASPSPSLSGSSFPVLPPRARALTGFASVGSGQASSPGSSNQPSINQVPGVSGFSSSATNISSNNSAANQVVGIEAEQSASATEVLADEDLENLPPPPPPPDILPPGPPPNILPARND
jgi:hypothetical protein